MQSQLKQARTAESPNKDVLHIVKTTIIRFFNSNTYMNVFSMKIVPQKCHLISQSVSGFLLQLMSCIHAQGNFRLLISFLLQKSELSELTVASHSLKFSLWVHLITKVLLKKSCRVFSKLAATGVVGPPSPGCASPVSPSHQPALTRPWTHPSITKATKRLSFHQISCWDLITQAETTSQGLHDSLPPAAVKWTGLRDASVASEIVKQYLHSLPPKF